MLKWNDNVAKICRKLNTFCENVKQLINIARWVKVTVTELRILVQK